MTAPLRGLVVRQPWATLAVLGIKTILDLPRRPKVERGETIAIVAGKARPRRGWTTSDAQHLVGRNDEGEWVIAYPDRHVPLPLGEVVGLVAVDDALPIRSGYIELLAPPHLHAYDDCPPWRTNPTPVLWEKRRARGVNHSDQLPLGDFTEGRWGLLLSNPRPCSPVPVKGAQGVFTLPDDVAAQINNKEQ